MWWAQLLNNIASVFGRVEGSTTPSIIDYLVVAGGGGGGNGGGSGGGAGGFRTGSS